MDFTDVKWLLYQLVLGYEFIEKNYAQRLENTELIDYIKFNSKNNIFWIGKKLLTSFGY